MNPSIDHLFCRVRKEHVRASPEEKIRQHVVNQLIDVLAYPQAGIIVEKALAHCILPERTSQKIPFRRIDIAFFGGKDFSSFSPLVVIECKALPLKEKMFRQVLGYNHFMQAPCVVLTNGEEVMCAVLTKEVQLYDRLLSYTELLTLLT